MGGLSRRRFLASGALAAGALAAPRALRDALAATARGGAGPYGELGAPDALGLMLPPGFRAREIARSLKPVARTGFVPPIFPDGQAVFATRDGGWILVTNSESLSATGAGATAIRFSPRGEIVDAYRILGDTHANCAGGPTPWGTWLSCEEYDFGMVWECDPAGVLRARARPAMGLFTHEAAAVDPEGGRVYMTEDAPDGGLYRFTPARYPYLEAGLLEVAAAGAGGAMRWTPVPDPAPSATAVPTRRQVAGMTTFNSAEGIWYAGGALLFTTKGDGRVWSYNLRTNVIEVLYDQARTESSLDAVDNVTVSAAGEIFVCEDSGNMEIGLVTPERVVSPFLRFTGDAHSASEVCGAAFDPSGTRLYFTSQRAYPPRPGIRGPGAVYEVTGPFRQPSGAPAAVAYGPPAGERRGGGPLGRPRIRLRTRVRRRLRRALFLRRGVTLTLSANERLRATVTLDSAELATRPGRGGSARRPKTIVLARARLDLAHDEQATLRLRPRPRARRLIERGPRRVRLRLVIVTRDAAGNRRTQVRFVSVLG